MGNSFLRKTLDILKQILLQKTELDPKMLNSGITVFSKLCLRAVKTDALMMMMLTFGAKASIIHFSPWDATL